MKTAIDRYNAVRIDVLGNIPPIWIEDFSDEECLAKSVDAECERIDRVMTEQLEQVSKEMGFGLMGFVDGMGYSKNYTPNPYMQEIAAYHLLLGPGVLCGMRNYDYAPLETEQADKLLGYLKERLYPACTLRELGESYLMGQNGLPQDTVLAEKYFLEAAEGMDARAYAWLGYLYSDEQYECKNIQKAAYWLQEATCANDDMGWLVLALFIGWDEYYPFQPRYIRYCLDKSMELSDEESFEELLDYFTKEDAENIKMAKPLKPEYPRLNREEIFESRQDAHEMYQQALDLLDDETTLTEGMNLMLEAADLGHSDACHYAGCRLYDYGQGDNFHIDEDGTVVAFPVDEKRAWKYLLHTGLVGNTSILQVLPYMGVEEQHARKFLELYVELTGDKIIPQYILPNLKKVLKMEKDASGICDEYIVPLEQELAYLFREKDSLSERIDTLQQAFRDATHREYGDAMAWRLMVDSHDFMAKDWEQKLTDRDKIEQLLDSYLYMQKLQER